MKKTITVEIPEDVNWVADSQDIDLHKKSVDIRIDGHTYKIPQAVASIFDMLNDKLNGYKEQERIREYAELYRKNASHNPHSLTSKTIKKYESNCKV